MAAGPHLRCRVRGLGFYRLGADGRVSRHRWLVAIRRTRARALPGIVAAFEVGKSYLVTMRDDTLGHLPQVVSPEGGFSPVGSPTRRKRPDLTCLRVQMTATGWQLTDAVIFEIGTTCVFAHFGRHFTMTCSGQTTRQTYPKVKQNICTCACRRA
jgi:hypothetical protein